MGKLKHSAPDWCFFKPEYEPAAYYKSLRAIGYQGVEMVAPERMKAARDAGLEILNLSGPGKARGLCDRANHAELLAEIRASIDFAQRHQIGQVIVFSGNGVADENQTGLTNVVAALKQVAPQAQQAGITLAFEMFNTFNHPGYLADHSAFGFEVARQVASPAMKVLFDIYHMHRMKDDVQKEILGNLSAICHLHTAASPKRNRPDAGGEIDYATLVPAIQRAGYAAYWGHEFVPEGDSIEELKKVYARFEEWAA